MVKIQMITINDVITITALVLAIVSIWLSLYFYRLSNKVSEKIIANLNELKILSNKIEGFYNRVYEDTFSIMKKNYEVINKDRLTYIDSQIKSKMVEEIEVLIKNEFPNHLKDKYLEDNGQLKQLAEDFFQKAASIENTVKEQTYLSEITNIINDLNINEQDIYMDDIVKEANSKGIEFRDVIKELIKLKNKNAIFFREPINALTIISKK